MKSSFCTVLLPVLAAIALPAQTLTKLFDFNSSDGRNPEAALVQAEDGNLYGTATLGGRDAEGSVFKVNTAGQLSTLYTFCPQPNCVDGAAPSAGLFEGANGNFYGTTSSGGANSFYSEYGTVFEITPGGALTTLYSFCSQPGCVDGAGPVAGVIQTFNGSLYGTTGVGGANTSCFLGCGTVFKINPAGTLTTLYNFCSKPSCADGADPEAPLIVANDGNLYGTTRLGGTHNQGTIFKIISTGALVTLYDFCSKPSCADGAGPVAGLVQAADGNLYGTTRFGSANCAPAGCGTLFKITLGGQLTTLYTFCTEANCADGAYPFAGLIQATDGNLYGTSELAGANSSVEDYGTVFKITPTGILTTLYNFCSQPNCADGAAPAAALTQATNGNFYGTTQRGGTFGAGIGGYGTVFELSVGLGPFVKARRNFGKVGTSIELIGTNLTGSTSVTFNRVAASFTVNSSSSLMAKVPTGATSGEIEVFTPGANLLSNVPFTVLP